jgi:hypothetical protein
LRPMRTRRPAVIWGSHRVASSLPSACEFLHKAVPRNRRPATPT